MRFSDSLKHGRPLQVLDMGETDLDEDTFDEYLMEMRKSYTAEKVRFRRRPATNVGLDDRFSITS